MTEEQESDKKVSDGSGITTTGDVHISVGSGQLGIGKVLHKLRYHKQI